MRFKWTAVLKGMLVVMMAVNTQASEIFSDKVKSFEVSPQVCIVKKIGEQCELQTTVRWETTQVMEVCLIQQKAVLQCWKDLTNIDEKMAIVLSEATLVSLVDRDNDKLASELLQVNALNPKKQRRRLRSPWSLF